MSDKKIYLDYASASPVDERVIKAMQPFYSDIFFNAGAIYDGGLMAKNELSRSRKIIAQSIGAKPAEIIFTSGGSESNNLAIQGVMNNFRSSNLLVSQIEHDSVIKSAANFNHQFINVNEAGLVDIEDLTSKVDGKTVLISIQHANNEIGTIQPIKELSQVVSLIRKERANTSNNLPLYLHVDACQSINYLDVNVSRLGIDLMSINGGKIYGPKGSGALFVRAGTKIKPLIYGGGQEFGLRSGTENLAGIVGLVKAFEIAQNTKTQEADRLKKLSKYFYKELLQNIPTIILNGPKKNRLPNNLNISFEAVDNERLIIRLDMAGVVCSAGSACSASSSEPSHVLKAIGINNSMARSSVRFSLGRQTTKKEIEMALKKIVDAIELEQ